MHSILPLFLFTLMACENKVPAGSYTDTGDSGLANNQTSDADADDDADADADDDPDCTEADLKFDAEIRSMDGEQISTISTSQSAKIWAVVHNECTQSIAFATENNCLVKSWSITTDGDESVGEYPCSGPSSSRAIDAADTLEQEIIALHDLAVGTYEISVVYGHTDGAGDPSMATVTLGVVNPSPAR